MVGRVYCGESVSRQRNTGLVADQITLMLFAALAQKAGTLQRLMQTAVC